LILILIPIAGLVLGVVLWITMRGLGAFNVLGAEAGPYSSRTQDRPEATNLRERIEYMPRGCLLSVVVACGVWVLGWLIALIVGLSLLA
jgi:hypothetical protein